MKSLHSEFRKGQRIMIIMLNGDRIITKYQEKTSKGMITDAGRINLKDVRSVIIYKAPYAVAKP